MKNHKQVKWLGKSLPKCDFCGYTAHFDGRVRGASSWAYMCYAHFTLHGVGLGLGYGQELILEKGGEDDETRHSS